VWTLANTNLPAIAIPMIAAKGGAIARLFAAGAQRLGNLAITDIYADYDGDYDVVEGGLPEIPLYQGDYWRFSLPNFIRITQVTVAGSAFSPVQQLPAIAPRRYWGSSSALNLYTDVNSPLFLGETVTAIVQIARIAPILNHQYQLIFNLGSWTGLTVMSVMSLGLTYVQAPDANNVQPHEFVQEGTTLTVQATPTCSPQPGDPVVITAEIALTAMPENKPCQIHSYDLSGLTSLTTLDQVTFGDATLRAAPAIADPRTGEFLYDAPRKFVHLFWS
jgi:hypothetical protein